MNSMLISRRAFSLMGLSAAFATRGWSESSRVLSPENLEEALPSSQPASTACAELPLIPPPPSELTVQQLFPGFKSQFLKTSSVTIRVLTKGDGPPLLLLHGHPETHVTWHKIATRLAEKYTVVLTDLRGYGDSSKPDGGDHHSNYSFRAMAVDQVEIMQHLGFAQFMLAGHDRGGRVAHRLCLDYPNLVQKVAFLDIAPTLTMYNETNKEFATKYVWWFFQIQPEPMPEHLIGLDPVYYLREHLYVQCKTPGAVTPEAMAEYIRCYCCKQTIHAACEDYRAAASIDLDMDRSDETAGRKIQAPVLALWGTEGTVGKMWDVLSSWRSKAANQVTGRGLPCGHLLPEETPEQVLAEFCAFFQA